MSAAFGPPYKLVFTITEDDVVAFVRLLQRRLNMIGTALGLVVMTVGGIIGVLARDPFTGVWTFLVGLLFVVLSGTEFLDRWRVKRGARSLIGSTGSFIIDERGITADPPTDAGRRAWSEITDIQENDRILIVKRGRTPVVWVPKRAFASDDEAAAVVSFVRAHISPTS